MTYAIARTTPTSSWYQITRDGVTLAYLGKVNGKGKAQAIADDLNTELGALPVIDVYGYDTDTRTIRYTIASDETDIDQEHVSVSAGTDTDTDTPAPDTDGQGIGQADVDIDTDDLWDLQFDFERAADTWVTHRETCRRCKGKLNPSDTCQIGQDIYDARCNAADTFEAAKWQADNPSPDTDGAGVSGTKEDTDTDTDTDTNGQAKDIVTNAISQLRRIDLINRQGESFGPGGIYWGLGRHRHRHQGGHRHRHRHRHQGGHRLWHRLGQSPGRL